MDLHDHAPRPVLHRSDLPGLDATRIDTLPLAANYGRAYDTILASPFIIHSPSHPCLQIGLHQSQHSVNTAVDFCCLIGVANTTQ